MENKINKEVLNKLEIKREFLNEAKVNDDKYSGQIQTHCTVFC